MTLPYRYLKLLIRPMPRIERIQNFSISQFFYQQQILITGPLAKMVNKAQKQKKKHKSKTSKFVPQHSDPISEMTRKFGPSEGSKRRAQHVSLILYDYITQIINSGDLSPKIAAMMVEVTQVKMLPDFSAIHIYWRGSSTNRDDEVNKLLKEKEVKMRTLLTAYRPISKIPQIVFQKDEDEARLTELNKLFDTADYGDDYVPSTEKPKPIHHEPIIYIDNMKAEQIRRIGDSFEDGETEIIHMNSKDEIKMDQIKSTLYNKDNLHSDDNDPNNTLHRYECIKDEFRDNLYGLNHTDLKKKIQLWSHKIKHRKGLECGSPLSSVKLDLHSPGLSKKWRQKKIHKSDYIDTSISDYMENKNDEKYDDYEPDSNYDSEDDEH